MKLLPTYIHPAILITSCCLSLSGCGDSRPQSSINSPAQENVTIYREDSFRAMPVKDVYFQLMAQAKTRALSWREHHDLAVAKALMGDFAGAQAAFESASAVVDREVTTDDAKHRAKALSFISAAQCASLAGRPYDAAKLANLAAECDRENKKVAVIRLGLWIAADDQLEVAAAREHVKRLSVTMDPNVHEKGLIGGIVMTIASGVYLGWESYKQGEPPKPEVVMKCLSLIATASFLPPPL